MAAQTSTNNHKETPKPKRSLTYQRDKDREIVKGMFKFYEVPGGKMSFVYKAHKGDQVERYDLIDGQIYSIPLGVARHLNKNGWYPVHSYALDDVGKASMRIGEKKRRFGFQSLEFVDLEDMGDANESGIITVEKIG